MLIDKKNECSMRGDFFSVFSSYKKCNIMRYWADGGDRRLVLVEPNGHAVRKEHGQEFALLKERFFFF